MRIKLIDSIVETALDGEGVSQEQALAVGTLDREELDYLFVGTDKIREKFKEQKVKICSIMKNW